MDFINMGLDTSLLEQLHLNGWKVSGVCDLKNLPIDARPCGVSDLCRLTPTTDCAPFADPDNGEPITLLGMRILISNTMPSNVAYVLPYPMQSLRDFAEKAIIITNVEQAQKL